MDFLKIVGLCVLVAGMTGCKKKSEAVTKEIREAGYEMTADGWFRAVSANDVSVMKKMVGSGFDRKTLDAEGNSALHIAATGGHKEASEYLLNLGVPIDEAGATARTPLMMAVVADQTAMVKWLLRQGADPKAKDRDGFTALMLAVSNGRRNAVEELAPYNREDLDSALLLAALVGKTDTIDALTNYGASVYARMEDGRTPLMLAAQNGHKQAAALLIDIGASRFATTDNGDTAQSLAVAAGHEDLAKMIESGFQSDSLALESEEQIAEAMNNEIAAAEVEPGGVSDDGLVAVNGDEIPAGEGRDVAKVGETARGEASSGQARDAEQPRDAGRQENSGQARSTSRSRANQPIVSLEGARVSKPRAPSPAAPKSRRSPAAAPQEEELEELPLVMRTYRERELPVEVKKVSGGVASLRLAGAVPRDVQVSAGETIPQSNILVVKVFTRMETGKLNNSQPVEVGIVEVEDKTNGQRREWVAGQSASGHDPVALVEDAATGQRYVAKPGQRFTSENGREFVVSDVRPSQLIIEDVASGEVRTLRLRGPKG